MPQDMHAGPGKLLQSHAVHIRRIPSLLNMFGACEPRLLRSGAQNSMMMVRQA